MIETGFSGTTDRRAALDHLHSKLDGIRRQLNWLAIGVAVVWLIALVARFVS